MHRSHAPALSIPVLLLASLLAAPAAHAQGAPEARAQTPSIPRSSVFVQNGGLGGVVSLNVERQVGERVSLNVGVAYQNHVRYAVVPFSLNYLVDVPSVSPAARLELGLGAAVWPGSDTAVRRLVGVAPVAAWRQQLGRGGWFYRIAYQPGPGALRPALSIGRGL